MLYEGDQVTSKGELELSLYKLDTIYDFKKKFEDKVESALLLVKNNTLKLYLRRRNRFKRGRRVL